MTIARNASEKEAIERIKKEGIPVIIFGAGIVGEVLFRACREAGINVQCFCDNNINKTKSPICNVEVVYAPALKTRYKDANIIISAADIRDVVDQLRDMGYSKWYGAGLLLREFDVYQYEFSAPADFVEYGVATCLLCQDNYLCPDKIFIRSVDIIITERCSLKCRDCSNLMQYYKKPADCNIKDLLQSIDAFCGVIDEVNEFRVIGGEPFMNKEFHLITTRLINEPKVKRVVIYTNGTIVPGDDQIKHLKNKKVLVIITDYGNQSGKLNKLIDLLRQNNIAYYAQKAGGWTDCARIMKHNRNREQQKDVFRRCCAKNTITLSKGKLFRCPFSANADRLRAVPNYEGDYIDLLQQPIETMDKYETKKRIRAFLLGKYFLEICDYCNGRPFEAPEITPAIQTAKPLEYERYDEQC